MVRYHTEHAKVDTVVALSFWALAKNASKVMLGEGLQAWQTGTDDTDVNLDQTIVLLV